jgi:hypothetical protein
MGILELLANLFDSVISGLVSPVYALPLDIFRILFGVLCFLYFLRTYREARNFSNPDGLLDHTLTYSLFPYCRISVFQNGMSLAFFQTIFLLACFASGLLVIGVLVKPAAIFLFVITVSTYRWNFLVMYLDDTIMHLILFWMMLLPVGNTLVLTDWLADKMGSMELWQTVTVPGATARLFLVSITLIYLTAGLWKWTSSMWRTGIAVYVSQKIATSYWGHYLKPQHLPLLKIANYMVLVGEPIFPLVFLLPTNSPLKWMFLVGIVGFHLGIVATMKIPFANLIMASATIIAFRDEFMQLIFDKPSLIPIQSAGRFELTDMMALFLITCLILMLLWKAGLTIRISLANPNEGKIIAERYPNPMYAPLWAIGIGQSYHLYDGIDDANFHVQYDIVQLTDDGMTRKSLPQDLFPMAMREILLQSYLHGSFWLNIADLEPSQLKDRRQSIYTRYIQRYCQEHTVIGTIEVYATVQWVTADNLDLSQGVRKLMARFTSKDGLPVVDYCQLSPLSEV